MLENMTNEDSSGQTDLVVPLPAAVWWDDIYSSNKQKHQTRNVRSE